MGVNQMGPDGVLAARLSIGLPNVVFQCGAYMLLLLFVLLLTRLIRLVCLDLYGGVSRYLSIAGACTQKGVVGWDLACSRGYAARI